ncbi:hypothetical protein BURPS1710b_1605 [Burkholderia pseudomallei 1710b]|uniref:Uncharacterized protein n=1 Tax=Burkholderia pseudomallei (strain 1710b) TaxID=320372 RepID=Q3JTU4_BURP1|nr:hypothetical protein BURPS1710b_1605 [Burkholderia pseudomallei 1710b]
MPLLNVTLNAIFPAHPIMGIRPRRAAAARPGAPPPPPRAARRREADGAAPAARRRCRAQTTNRRRHEHHPRPALGRRPHPAAHRQRPSPPRLARLARPPDRQGRHADPAPRRTARAARTARADDFSAERRRTPVRPRPLRDHDSGSARAAPLHGHGDHPRQRGHARVRRRFRGGAGRRPAADRDARARHGGRRRSPFHPLLDSARCRIARGRQPAAPWRRSGAERPLPRIPPREPPRRLRGRSDAHRDRRRHMVRERSLLRTHRARHPLSGHDRARRRDHRSGGSVHLRICARHVALPAAQPFSAPSRETAMGRVQLPGDRPRHRHAIAARARASRSVSGADKRVSARHRSTRPPARRRRPLPGDEHAGAAGRRAGRPRNVVARDVRLARARPARPHAVCDRCDRRYADAVRHRHGLRRRLSLGGRARRPPGERTRVHRVRRPAQMKRRGDARADARRRATPAIAARGRPTPARRRDGRDANHPACRADLSSARSGSTYQTALAICSATSAPHALKCASAG